MVDEHAEEPVYANKNIPSFLKLPLFDANIPRSSKGIIQINLLQILDQGQLLTANAFQSKTLSIRHPVLVRDRPESIGMQLPDGSSANAITVRDIADVVGYSQVVHVIDVEYQEEMEGWTFADLVDYFEDEDRIHSVTKTAESSSPERTRPSRRAATQYIQKTRHRVLNQISFEFSQTPLANYVKSPSFVRDMDWIDHAWPHPSPHRPTVQYYCLTSAAGSYTDFHIDFGGTSVWYHVLSGSKEFCLIVPSERNLKIYEEWLDDSDQAHIFLADRIPNPHDVLRVALSQHQTLIIPAGWIHSVYTPSDSLVFGGNFLHGMDIERQLRIYESEAQSKLAERFRFPFFQPLHFYAAGMYLEKLIAGKVCLPELEELPHLVKAIKSWWTSDEGETDQMATVAGAVEYVLQQHGCSSFEDFLKMFQDQIDRSVRNGISPDKAPSGSPEVKVLTSSIDKATTPKIRLRIAPPKATSHSPATISSPPENDTSEFRIKLSSKSLRPEPLPSHVRVARSKAREDMSSFVDERELLKDEEWVPSQTEPPDEKVYKGRKTLSNPSAPKPKRVKVSGRDRLLKKLK
ncbi:F-box and leucine-rich repeat protein 10/11 [Fistulifera solaris]|uniref:F-box and leucine-rich repeat protein 10/11 n=1 Tax=Fistulifera solaris TaxID=1519565 RepID=A0A1Z5J8G8_FISSO|nr:F-box and leucine-rich repeat protein 10/11 [Fistulifera solaris]|eukprot:GAX10290.1 F-box and leucine-rich repeat protein 10/11 [Fistulifera solaris]